MGLGPRIVALSTSQPGEAKSGSESADEGLNEEEG